MHKLLLIATLMLGLLAGCTAGGQTVEPDLESGPAGDDDGPTLELVTPSGAEYPAPETGVAYPAAPDEAAMPTGYPELTVVAPSGEVDLADLTPVAPSDTTPQVMPSPGRPGAAPPQLAVMVETILIHLGQQTGRAADEIRFVSAEPVTWPNGGLGCPAEGLNYIDVQVEGSLITLEVDGQPYTYHTDGGRNFVLCQDGRPVSSGVVPGR